MPLSPTKLIRKYGLAPELLADKHPNVADLIDELQDAVGDGGGGGGASDAADVAYDHTDSGLDATDVQGAIDELKTDVDNAGGGGSTNNPTVAYPTTYLLNIEQPGGEFVEGAGRIPGLSGDDSAFPGPGQEVGAANIFYQGLVGLWVNAGYSYSFDNDGSNEGSEPNLTVITPSIAQASVSLYNPASPVDLSAAVYLSGEFSFAPNGTPSIYPGSGTHLDVYFFTDVEPVDGIYDPQIATDDLLGIRITYSDDLSNAHIRGLCSSSSNGQTQDMGVVDLTKPHTVKFFFGTSGQDVESEPYIFYLDGVSLGSFSANRQPHLNALTHFFVVTMNMDAPDSQADSVAWSGDDEAWEASNGSFNLLVSNFKLRSF